MTPSLNNSGEAQYDGVDNLVAVVSEILPEIPACGHWSGSCVGVRDSGWLLPDNKGSEHAGPGVTTSGGVLAPAEKHSGFPGSISMGHGAMKRVQVIWHGTTHPVCSLSCHPYF